MPRTPEQRAKDYIDAVEDARLAPRTDPATKADEERAIRTDEARFEAHIYGEDRNY